jgi:ankyrin repeat protein
MQNFLAISSAGGDIEAVDKVGRTVLHWAVIGGNVDVIERVLSLNRQLLYQRDNDGWTPLLWACRGAGTVLVSRSQAVQKAVIALLLKRGADAGVIAEGGGGNRSWSPLSVARFNGGEQVEGFMDWLIGEVKAKAGGTFNEDDEVHKSKRGKVHTPYCDSCLVVSHETRFFFSTLRRLLGVLRDYG